MRTAGVRTQELELALDSSVPENRAGDCLPVGSLDGVTGAIQGQEPRSADFVGERLPVLEREHRIGRALDDEGRHADRRERCGGQRALRGQAVVLGGGDIARAATERRCSWGRRSASVERMTIQRMEHVGIVVDDLAAATAFFVELGLKLQGEWSVEGGWVDRIVGLEGVQVDAAMIETPDGHGRLELAKFHAPSGPGGDRHAPANTPGLRHLAFAVDDIDAVVASLRARGAALVGEVEQYEDSYRLCYVRGPEGIIVELAEQIG